MDHPHSVRRCTPVLLDKSKESPCHQGPTLLVENEIEGVGVGRSCSPRRQISRRYIAPAGPLASYFLCWKISFARFAETVALLARCSESSVVQREL